MALFTIIIACTACNSLGAVFMNGVLYKEVRSTPQEYTATVYTVHAYGRGAFDKKRYLDHAFGNILY